MTDVAFDPIKYGFRWTEDSDGGMGWYEYDGKVAENAAKRDRNKYAKEQRALGKTVKVSTTKSLRTMGGIGTNHPEISLVVPIYRALVIE